MLTPPENMIHDHMQSHGPSSYPLRLSCISSPLRIDPDINPQKTLTGSVASGLFRPRIDSQDMPAELGKLVNSLKRLRICDTNSGLEDQDEWDSRRVPKHAVPSMYAIVRVGSRSSNHCNVNTLCSTNKVMGYCHSLPYTSFVDKEATSTTQTQQSQIPKFGCPGSVEELH